MRRSLLLLLFCPFVLTAAVRAESLAIIVSKSVPIDNVSSEELSRIFRCEETEGPGGIKFVVFSRERTAAERAVILKLVYRMNDASYSRFFMQAVMAGRMDAAPRIVPSAASMRNIAAANPGAVTYVLASQVDNTVKALKIDGLAPGDPNYPLKVE